MEHYIWEIINMSYFPSVRFLKIPGVLASRKWAPIAENLCSSSLCYSLNTGSLGKVVVSKISMKSISMKFSCNCQQ